MSATTLQQHQKEIDDAERLLFTGEQRMGLAKGLFFGRFIADWVMPYPVLSPDERAQLEAVLPQLREFLDETLDPVAIDRHADIPREVIDGLGRLGVLGMTAPTTFGGRGYSQMAYGRVLEEIGARCASTSVFVNAHHSIGIRALLLFGTPEQKRQWLPPLVSGRHLASFALTEPEAGSDAANVQTRAEPSPDGSSYILNGEKRYITNAAIAQVLTVMARTPLPGGDETAVTAFLVTPDMPGFAMVEPRMEKLGIRGTATGRLAFRDMPVPRENILGPLGKGLKVALSVLDFGRTTFGACSTGAAKTCLRLATHHAMSRRQFGRTLGEFELVRGKLARMAASIYAMEAMTTVTASLIDRGLEDYMLETAMLKVFTTEALWQIVNDAFQIYGGSAYFTDLPLERMLRDARINQIGEGANEVLSSFIALVGMRGPGMQFKEIWEALHHPAGHVRKAWQAGRDRADAALHAPEVPIRTEALHAYAHRLGKLVWHFNAAVDRTLIRHREAILDRQYLQERIAKAAMELFASACVLSRWDADLQRGIMHCDQAAALFLLESARRVERSLAELSENLDEALTAAADAVLRARRRDVAVPRHSHGDILPGKGGPARSFMKRELSYMHGGSAKPLIGRTIGEMLDDSIAQFGRNEALVSMAEQRRLTYAQLGAEVDRCARALLAAGIRQGDRVGIWSTNCIAWVIVQFATAKAGAILVNINPAYRISELEFALNQSEINFLFIGDGFKDACYAKMVGKLRGRLLHLHRVVSLAPAAGYMSWDEFLTGADGIEPSALSERQASLDFDDVINIQYTSGTTGLPKAAMLTHHNILNNGFWVAERMRFTSRDRLCIPVPFYHCFGMVLANLACVTHGATMVLPAPHFSPLHTLQAVASERCTALHGVPTMFIAELDHPRFGEFDLSTLRTGIMAGAPCPIELMKRVMSKMHLAGITIACGMTETSPVCNMTEVDDPIEVRVGTVGKVMPHQEQKIIDPVTDHIQPRGEPGELCYRGYQVMRGYFHDPEGTRQTIDEAGWLHGGDLAVMDARGYVRITGRLKDMICRGGEKVFPREVEEFLFTLPKIAEAYVIGIPDSYYGEQVIAWVKLKEGEAMTSDDLTAFCRGRIMDYKIPSRVKFVTEFPTTVTAKIQKYRMREISAQEMAATHTLGR